MTVLHLKSTSGPDGKLQIDIGVPNSEAEVTVVLQDKPPKSDEEMRKDWEAFVRRTAGSIQDPTFHRHPQGEYPKREPLK